MENNLTDNLTRLQPALKSIKAQIEDLATMVIGTCTFEEVFSYSECGDAVALTVLLLASIYSIPSACFAQSLERPEEVLAHIDKLIEVLAQ